MPPTTSSRPQVTASACSAPPAATCVAGSALLIDGGRRALVPSALLDAATTHVWLRNGSGQTVAARRDSAAALTAAALFRLQSPLPFETGDTASTRLPFAGSPAFVAEYANRPGSEAAWLWLRQGFLGGLARDGERRLGIGPGAGMQGGAVLDARGRVIGLALPGAREASWLAAARSAEAEGADAAAVPAAPREAGLPTAADEAHGRMLRITLQVVIEA